jgi:asparagine synthase (glutamine-hydrolysing)
VDTSVASDHQPNAVVDVDVVLSEAHTLSVESMTVRFEPERVVLTSGPFGTAPLFVAARQDLFIGSWHLPELAPLIQADQLLDRAVTRRLTRQPRYTTDTVLSGIHRLTERATAVFTRSGVSLSYPEPADHVLRPRDLRPGIDAVAALGELLTDVLVHTPAALGPVGAELSGGVDSANVALTLAAMRAQPLSSYGLILDGVVGDQQRRRRSAMVHRFGLRDSTVPAYGHPPFVPTGSRGLGRPHDPTSAYYREAFDALRDAVSAGGTRVICTGLGGDELVARRPHEWTIAPPPPDAVPWLGPTACAALAELDTNVAPIGPVPLTALMAQATHNPAYLAAGIWPVAPLAHPMLVRFGEQLPLEWRTGKYVLRERLRRNGMSAEVADPLQPETFTPLMQTGLRHYGLPMLKDMTKESRLVDLGYLDARALIGAYEKALLATHIPSTLCDAISLEVGLRSLDQAGCRS